MAVNLTDHNKRQDSIKDDHQLGHLKSKLAQLEGALMKKLVDHFAGQTAAKSQLGSAKKATALLTALLVASLGLSACNQQKDAAEAESGEVKAVDRVNEAEEIAHANAPAAEDMGFEQSAPAAATDTAEASGDAAATGDSAETSEVVSADGKAKANGEADSADASTGDASGMDPAAAGSTDTTTEEAHTAPTSK